MADKNKEKDRENDNDKVEQPVVCPDCKCLVRASDLEDHEQWCGRVVRTRHKR